MLIVNGYRKLGYPIIGKTKIALNKLVFSHDWYNVSEEHNNNIVTLKYKDQTDKIKIDDGFYCWEDYVKEIVNYLQQHRSGRAGKLKFNYNKLTGKVEIVRTGYSVVDIPVLDSENVPELPVIRYFYLTCNLVNDANDGQIIALIPIKSKKLGHTVSFVASYANYINVNQYIIDTIRLDLVNPITNQSVGIEFVCELDIING